MMYAETRNMTPYGNVGIANKTQNFEAVAQYQFDFGLRPSLAYVYSKGKDLGGNDYNNNGHQEYVDQIWSTMLKLERPTISIRTSQHMLTIK